MDDFLNIFPSDMINFILVIVFSLLIGLSQRKLQMRTDAHHLAAFGSDRTFTLIGILGYILYILSPYNLALFIGGGILISVFLLVSYILKIYFFKVYGLTSIVIALITYCLTPLVYTQPLWFYLLVVVVILLLTEMKEEFSNLAQRMNDDELVTLSKFIIISGIILPILPKDQIIPGINLTAYNIWLATVVIAGISYASYLLNKFVFRDSGVIITGIISGLYSSTAATVVLAKKSREAGANVNEYSAAILYATAMMYIRVLVLVAIFNAELLQQTWYYFIIMFIVSMVVGTFAYFYKRDTTAETSKHDVKNDKNPLEFKVALIFAGSFVLFTILTHYTLENFGSAGLKWLSILVGVTDVAPFLISLFQGEFGVGLSVIIAATFQSLISNNVIKLLYAFMFIGKQRDMQKVLVVGFSIITAVNILVLLIV